MSAQLNTLKRDVQKKASSKKAASSAWFFKTGKGEYGEGDRFLGLTVPEQRTIAKRFRGLPLADCTQLLKSSWHEHRLIALFILVDQFDKGDEKAKKRIVDLFLKMRSRVNNWDLVDSSAHKILGEFLADRSRNRLYTLARSRSLWDRRIAIIATMAFIQRGDLKEMFALAELLLEDKEDLMHKAVGWMLREAGKKDSVALERFLERHAHQMPRTMLRYAIEHFSKKKKAYYMQKGK